MVIELVKVEILFLIEAISSTQHCIAYRYVPVNDSWNRNKGLGAHRRALHGSMQPSLCKPVSNFSNSMIVIL